jgi:hypothetical protein
MHRYGSSCPLEVRSLVDDLPTDDGEQNLHVRYLSRRNLEWIALEHDQICELADLELPYVVLRVQRGSRVGHCGEQRTAGQGAAAA